MSVHVYHTVFVNISLENYLFTSNSDSPELKIGLLLLLLFYLLLFLVHFYLLAHRVYVLKKL